MAQTMLMTPEVRERWMDRMWAAVARDRDYVMARALVESWPESVTDERRAVIRDLLK